MDLSKHNYTQYSSKKNNANTRIEETKANMIDRPSFEPVEVKMEYTQPVLIQETVDTVTIPETVAGTVTGCLKLNVRVAPTLDADVVCVLSANAKVEIDTTKSTDEWFSICTAAGVKGYCMKKFVDASL